MNQVNLIGNIGKKPELRTVGNTSVVKFGLATSDTYTNKAGERVTNTSWHSIEAWGKQAEVLERYTDKGHKLQVTGELLYNTYTNKAGVEVTAAKIRLSSFEFLEPRDGSTTAQKSQAGKDEDNYDWTQDDALGF